MHCCLICAMTIKISLCFWRLRDSGMCVIYVAMRDFERDWSIFQMCSTNPQKWLRPKDKRTGLRSQYNDMIWVQESKAGTLLWFLRCHQSLIRKKIIGRTCILEIIPSSHKTMLPSAQHTADQWSFVFGAAGCEVVKTWNIYFHIFLNCSQNHL